MNGHKYTKLKISSRTLLCSSIMLAIYTPTVSAQDDLEEIVVTGSYIRNSNFTGASPVDTVEQETLLTYGAANIGQYIRDLTYTQNVDTVATVSYTHLTLPTICSV